MSPARLGPLQHRKVRVALPLERAGIALLSLRQTVVSHDASVTRLVGRRARTDLGHVRVGRVPKPTAAGVGLGGATPRRGREPCGHGDHARPWRPESRSTLLSGRGRGGRLLRHAGKVRSPRCEPCSPYLQFVHHLQRVTLCRPQPHRPPQRARQAPVPVFLRAQRGRRRAQRRDSATCDGPVAAGTEEAVRVPQRFNPSTPPLRPPVPSKRMVLGGARMD